MLIIRWFFIFTYLLGLFFVTLRFVPEKECYQRHPSIPEEVWNEAKPYFLPKDHPIKERLDNLFKQKRLLHSLETMQQGGFRILNGSSELDVAFHPQLPDYVIKF